MKTVFDNDMLAHVWAQRSQPHGRTSNGNFYFDGGTLYSYGSHFKVAKFVNLPDSGVCVFLNSASYSVSTGRHQRLARRASNHYKQFTVPHIPGLVDCDRETHLKNIAHFEETIFNLTAKAKRARSNKEWYERRAVEIAETMRDYAATFGLEGIQNATEVLSREHRLDRFNRAIANIETARNAKTSSLYYTASRAQQIWDNASLAADLAHGLGIEHTRIELTRFESAAIDKAIKYWGLDWRAQYMSHHWTNGFKAFEEKLERLDAIRDAQALLPTLMEQWRKGELRNLDRYSLRDVEGISDAVLRELHIAFNEQRGALLRISGDDVETSRGARFPAEHAKRAFRLVAACREKGQAYERGEHSIHLGHFTIDSIDKRGNVRAGCHYVEWPAIESAARQLWLVV